MRYDRRNVCFVLSAGRTGTVFLANLLRRQFPETMTVHEPYPARYELVLANVRNETGLGDSVLRWLFTTARRRRLRQLPAGMGYVEINPLLCPLVDLVAELPDPFNVVHLVREPLSWAKSIVQFRASSRIRPWIDVIPFTKPYPCPRPAGWASMPEIERALWRWRFCNENILRIRPRCREYALIRYEDLFSADTRSSSSSLRRLAELLPVKGALDLPTLHQSTKTNPAPTAEQPKDLPVEAVRAVCGELMVAFGYGA